MPPLNHGRHSANGRTLFFATQLAWESVLFQLHRNKKSPLQVGASPAREGKIWPLRPNGKWDFPFFFSALRVVAPFPLLFLQAKLPRCLSPSKFFGNYLLRLCLAKRPIFGKKQQKSPLLRDFLGSFQCVFRAHNI